MGKGGNLGGKGREGESQAGQDSLSIGRHIIIRAAFWTLTLSHSHSHSLYKGTFNACTRLLELQSRGYPITLVLQTGFVHCPSGFGASSRRHCPATSTNHSLSIS